MFFSLFTRKLLCEHLLNGFFFGKNGNPAPSDVIREPHGRISFAHAELLGYQMWEGAAHAGERAAHQLREI